MNALILDNDEPAYDGSMRYIALTYYESLREVGVDDIQSMLEKIDTFDGYVQDVSFTQVATEVLRVHFSINVITTTRRTQASHVNKYTWSCYMHNFATEGLLVM